VRAYIELFDNKGAASRAVADDDAALAGLSAEERKKEKLRRKKEEKRVAKEAADRAAAEVRAVDCFRSQSSHGLMMGRGEGAGRDGNRYSGVALND
jgi:membrane protein involved in colicin uptake